MSFKHKFIIKKLLSSTLILSLVLPFTFFSFPKKTEAQWVVIDPAHISETIISIGVQSGNLFTNLSQTIKEYVGDSLANIIAKMILRKLTAQTVNWINSSDFKNGGPAFVQNPVGFFSDIADNVAGDFLSNTNLSKLCSPFRAEIRLSLVKNYLQEDPYGYTCTLGEVVNNYDNFINDFSQGGWSSWFTITQSSQNNPYGAYLGARNALSVNVASEQDKYQKQLDWGNGFLSYERCKQGTGTPTPIQTGPLVSIIDRGDRACGPEDMETVTPGKVIDDQLSNALGSSWKQLEAADEINEIVSALVIQLTQRVVGGAVSGLKGLSGGGADGGQLLNELSKAEPTDEEAALLEKIENDNETQTGGVENAAENAGTGNSLPPSSTLTYPPINDSTFPPPSSNP